MTLFCVGSVGNDPDTKMFDSGSQVTKFSVADRLTYTKKDEPTEWRNIVCWSKLSETAAAYIKKGSLVAVVGELVTERYEKDGVEVQKPVIKASKLVLLDKKPTENSEISTASTSTATLQTTSKAKPQTDDLDSIPF